MSNKEREDFAYIESSVCDMGQYGYSWCSACHTELDLAEIMKQQSSVLENLRLGNSVNTEIFCPKVDCGKLLKFGGIWTPSGGSDF